MFYWGIRFQSTSQDKIGSDTKNKSACIFMRYIEKEASGPTSGATAADAPSWDSLSKIPRASGIQEGGWRVGPASSSSADGHSLPSYSGSDSQVCTGSLHRYQCDVTVCESHTRHRDSLGLSVNLRVKQRGSHQTQPPSQHSKLSLPLLRVESTRVESLGVPEDS